MGCFIFDEVISLLGVFPSASKIHEVPEITETLKLDLKIADGKTLSFIEKILLCFIVKYEHRR